MAKTDEEPAKMQKYVEEGEKVRSAFKGLRKKTAEIQREFVEFINRGSVVDLAIGVAVGGAFNTIVNSFVNDIVMPIVGLIAGGVDFNNLAIRIPNFFGADDEAVIAYGKFLQACLQFLIIAWVFFLIVRMMNRFHRKREEEQARVELLKAKRKKAEREKAERASTERKKTGNTNSFAKK